MKLPFKLTLLGLVGVLALPMFIAKPDGKPMMTASDWMPDQSTVRNLKGQFGAMVDSFSNGESSVASVIAPQDDVIPEFGVPGSGKVYSWKDANGVAHFSEQPPPADIQTAKVRAIPTSVNVMKSVKVPTGDATGGGYGAQSGQGFKLAFPSTIPVKQIPKLIEDAKGLQALADKRSEALSKI